MKISTEETAPRERVFMRVNPLFCVRGYLATGINQIVEEAQIAKASLDRHFSSKEVLVMEYIKMYNTNFLQELRSLEQQFADPKSKILALFDRLADFSLGAERRGCTAMNMVVEFFKAESIA